MVSRDATHREPTEVVIVSEGRRGECILLDEQGRDITREVEILLDQMIESANSINHTLQRMNRDTAAFVAEMRERRLERGQSLHQEAPSTALPQTPENTP